MGIMASIHKKLLGTAVKSLARYTPGLLIDKAYDRVKERIDKEIPYPEGRDWVLKMFDVMRKKFPQLSRYVREKAVDVFLIKAEIEGAKKRAALKEKLGYWAPFLFVVSPTMRCNLRCYGCYAGEYTKESDLPWELLDRVMREAKDIGIHFVVISGGEPFIYPHIWDLLEKHNDIFFQMYTNGTMIDKAAAKRIAELGNLLPCISVEGFEEETDKRRGKGHFKRVMAAMDALAEEGALFGYSATATRENNELVSSDEFVDFYQNKGCFIGWYFNYIPIGKSPVLDLMPTPKQRIERRKRLAQLRKEVDLLIADFWCDGTLCGGCIAGGRHYFHINNRGDVEPCVFCHFACDNIRDKSLVEIIDSPFFRSFRRRQPYVTNLLRPCAIIDNPHVLREAVRENNAHPTHPGAEQVITDFAPFLDKYAEEYGKLADEEWEKNYLPSYSEQERRILLDYLNWVKKENERIFAPREVKA